MAPALVPLIELLSHILSRLSEVYLFKCTTV